MSSQQHPQYLQIPEIIIYFICRIESSFPDERTTFVRTFCKHFIQRIESHALLEKQENGREISSSQKHSSEKGKQKYYTDTDVYDIIDNGSFDFIMKGFMPHIIHNRFMCPFKEINTLFVSLIKTINVKLAMKIPESCLPYRLSQYLDSSLVKINVPFQNADHNNNHKYTDLYLRFGRITHFELLLLSFDKYFSEYLLSFNDLLHSLMYDNNGPLSREKREYLGLMGASRYDCPTVLMQSELRYTLLKGDLTFLKSGIKSAPQIYQKLSIINAFLAHQPWLITKKHISDLLDSNSNWTLSQCLHSILILIMFHFLAGMHYALAITPEIDQYYISKLSHHRDSDIRHIFNGCNGNEYSSNCHYEKGNNNEKINNINIAQLLSSTSSTHSQLKSENSNKEKDFEQSAIIMDFDPDMSPSNAMNVQTEEKEEKVSKKEIKKHKKIVAPKNGGHIYWKYSFKINMTYKDFDCHKKGCQIHCYGFNWDKHGYALVSRYYPGMEKKMDKVFRVARSMTDNSIGNHTNYNTEPFRMAVWHYTFRLYGVNNDSYEYQFVNKLLPVKLKIFIKKLVCYPQIITIHDFKEMGVTLKECEKIHIAILALEAKKQASLLHALRAIRKCIQSK